MKDEKKSVAKKLYGDNLSSEDKAGGVDVAPLLSLLGEEDIDSSSLVQPEILEQNKIEKQYKEVLSDYKRALNIYEIALRGFDTAVTGKLETEESPADVRLLANQSCVAHQGVLGQMQALCLARDFEGDKKNTQEGR